MCMCKYLFETLLSNLWGMCPGVELVDHMTVHQKFKNKMIILLLIVEVIFCIPTGAFFICKVPNIQSFLLSTSPCPPSLPVPWPFHEADNETIL